MTPDELNAREAAHRDLIEALRRASQDTQASPDFVARVMARAEQVSLPRRPWLPWLRLPSLWLAAPRWRLAMAAIFVLAVIGAIPQYLAWINAYVMGVPAAKIYEARVQERLWQKNFACATQLDHSSSNYAVINGEELVVVAWACPSGDVLVTVEAADDQDWRRSVWVSLEERQSFTRRFPWRPRAAHADAEAQVARKRAEPVVEVLCQRWLPNRFIKRRVQLADGNCFDETINPRTGQVVQRQKAPCDRGC
jgi:hypothetical protein